MDDTLALVALSTAIFIASLRLSRWRSGLWLMDPRGFFAAVLFMNVAGVPLYRLFYGEWPSSFGLTEENIVPATLMLISGQLAFLLGSLAVRPTFAAKAPGLTLTERESDAYGAVLLGAVLVTGLFNYVGIATKGVDQFFSQRYGEGTFELHAEGSLAIVQIASVCVPSLTVYLVMRGLARKPLNSKLTIAAIIYVILPTLVGGGRREVILVLLSLAIARAARQGKLRLRSVAALAVTVFVISFVLAYSRSAQTLNPSDRIAKLGEVSNEESTTFGASVLLVYSGTSILSAAMTVFPHIVPHSYGTTYFETIVNTLTPHFITGSYVYTPQALAFRELFYGNSIGFGFDYSLPAEAYQNFGYAGPALVLFIVGCVMNATFELSLRGGARSLWIAVHVVFFSAFFFALRTDSNGTLKPIIYGIVWLVLLRRLTPLLMRSQSAVVRALRARNAKIQR